MVGVVISKRHLTHKSISENEEFSVCVPGADLIKEVDCCGVVSGREADKSGLFKVFYGELKGAPMIEQCPVCMECKMVDSVNLPTNTLFIGEIVGAYSEEKFLTNGKPDIRKIQPFVLTMPESKYCSVGEALETAWSAGKEIAKKIQDDFERDKGEVPDAEGVVKEEDILGALSEEMGYQRVNLDELRITPELLAVVPANIAKRYRCFPAKVDKRGIHLACADPLNPSAIKKIEEILQKKIMVRLAPEDDIETLIAEHYGK
jgi:flavin reductase (DIM6/NTAB) family NADH-FMN oxidoreductase RutF